MKSALWLCAAVFCFPFLIAAALMTLGLWALHFYLWPDGQGSEG